MFAGIQKSVYPAFAGFLTALVGQILTGEGGPTDAQISAIAVSLSEVVVSLVTGGLVAVAAYAKANINVNGVVMRFVDPQGNIQNASGDVVGKVALRAHFGVTVVALALVLGLAACGANGSFKSPLVMTAAERCNNARTALIAAEVNADVIPPEHMDRLRKNVDAFCPVVDAA